MVDVSQFHHPPPRRGFHGAWGFKLRERFVERIPLNSRGTRNGIPSHDFQCHRQEVMLNGGTNANEVRFLCALSIPEQYSAEWRDS